MVYFKGSLKVLDKAALFRESYNPCSTSAFNGLPGTVWIEGGAGSPLVEKDTNGAVEKLIYF